MTLLAPGIPLSLYIHLPWCVEKCPYCDFNSHKLPEDFSGKLDDDANQQNYVNHLFSDLEADLPAIWGRSVESIFIGGGTPSLFSGTAIDNLLSGVRSRLMLVADIEVTLESNPGTADANNYIGYRNAGVNRLSIGVQSFDDQHLKQLGRIHNSAQSTSAFNMARTAGFKRINIDIMYALPAQTVTSALDDLNKAIALNPEHISWYQLTIEPNTIFNSHPPKQLPDDDLIWDIQQAGMKKLQTAGYIQYEVSAWCKPGEECLHNLNYWQFGDYLGIGAGAHGKITDFSSEQIVRTRRKKQPKQWLTDNKVADNTAIATNDLALEFMLNAMRLNKGVSSQSFSERTGLPITNIQKQLSHAKQQGLLIDRFDKLCPTPKGQNYLNNLLALFMIDEGSSPSINIKQVL